MSRKNREKVPIRIHGKRVDILLKKDLFSEGLQKYILELDKVMIFISLKFAVKVVINIQMQ